MAITIKSASPLHTHFFSPLLTRLAQLKSFRSCPKLSDADWLQIGIGRALESVRSGRDFLQSMQSKLRLPDVSHFFATLKSKRRLALCTEANTALCATLTDTVPDVFAAYPALAGFDLYAADGHAHAAAAHDVPQPSKTGFTKFATSHIYALNLRTHGMSHLALADQITRRKEHEMRTLKRLTIVQLRQGAPAGRKVLYIYDPACLDYTLWHQLKKQAIYFLTRMKSNAALTQCGDLAYTATDPLNAGVHFDRQVGIAGRMVRQVRYQCPKSGEIFDFLTNEMKIPPGLIARLYQMRWDIEKSYDEIKNKLNEPERSGDSQPETYPCCWQKKAWASSATAKAMQATFICLAHNLMVQQEHRLLVDEQVSNTSEIKRKAARLGDAMAILTSKNEVMPVLQQVFQRHTQRSVKYLRWLRAWLYLEAPWQDVVAKLRESYRVV